MTDRELQLRLGVRPPDVQFKCIHAGHIERCRGARGPAIFRKVNREVGDVVVFQDILPINASDDLLRSRALAHRVVICQGRPRR